MSFSIIAFAFADLSALECVSACSEDESGIGAKGRGRVDSGQAWAAAPTGPVTSNKHKPNLFTLTQINPTTNLQLTPASSSDTTITCSPCFAPVAMPPRRLAAKKVTKPAASSEPKPVEEVNEPEASTSKPTEEGEDGVEAEVEEGGDGAGGGDEEEGAPDAAQQARIEKMAQLRKRLVSD